MQIKELKNCKLLQIASAHPQGDGDTGKVTLQHRSGDDEVQYQTS